VANVRMGWLGERKIKISAKDKANNKLMKTKIK